MKKNILMLVLLAASSEYVYPFSEFSGTNKQIEIKNQHLIYEELTPAQEKHFAELAAAKKAAEKEIAYYGSEKPFWRNTTYSGALFISGLAIVLLDNSTKKNDVTQIIGATAAAVGGFCIFASGVSNGISENRHLRDKERIMKEQAQLVMNVKIRAK